MGYLSSPLHVDGDGVKAETRGAAEVRVRGPLLSLSVSFKKKISQGNLRRDHSSFSLHATIDHPFSQPDSVQTNSSTISVGVVSHRRNVVNKSIMNQRSCDIRAKTC